MKRHFFRAFAVLSLLLSCTTAASAHVNGLSLEKVVGDYKVDVGFDEEEVAAGTTRWIDFWLLNPEGTEPRLFDAVWVRVARGDDVLLATTIHPTEQGGGGMLYAFAESGDHEIKVQFLKDFKALAEASFIVPVTGQVAKGSTSAGRTVGIGILSFAAGASAVMALRRLRRK